MKCVVDSCDLEPGQHLHEVDSTVDKRCVEYDGVPPPHCVSLVVVHYEIYNSYHVLQGTCMKIKCADGVSPDEECTNPWILPAPAEPPPGAP